ncbi:MAG: IclR family transcriptional regulator, partial [Burkholderiales bacterium]|nr:IclR family transcriptional regulator [Burkholderiales bacterium]
RSLADLSTEARLPKPTLYRMLGMLAGAGLVAREPGTRRWAPGPRLAALARNTMLNGGLARAARRAVLARLVEAIGETCNFTMLDGAEVLYLERVEAAWPLRMALAAGSRVPVHCTASGKLLLAMLPKESRTRLLAHLSLSRHTAATITDRAALEAELARIRAQGYATDNEEYLAGLVCIAVPVAASSRRAVAALAVQAPASRMPLARALEHLPLLRRAAGELSETLEA